MSSSKFRPAPRIAEQREVCCRAGRGHKNYDEQLVELFGGEQTLDAISAALISAYGWAKEWQILLAGVLVLVAALIVARAIRKARPPVQRGGQNRADLDMRLAPRPTSLAPISLA